MARMYARTPVFANSARYFVEPLAFGGLVVAVLVLAAKRTRFFRYPPEPRRYGACGLSAAALAPVALRVS